MQDVPEDAPVTVLTSVSAAAHAQSDVSSLGADDPFSEAAAAIQHQLRQLGAPPRRQLLVRYTPLHLQPLPAAPNVGFLVHMGDAIRAELQESLAAARWQHRGQAQV